MGCVGPEETSAKDNSTIRALIVEDEALEAFLLSNCFKLEGYQVCEIASQGTEAIRLAALTHPDILIMDNGLAGALTGVDAARQIRAFSSVPILFLTGFLSDELKNQVKGLAPADYLVKPARFSDVLASVTKLLG